MRDTLILLSAGLDSAANLALAARERRAALCLTFDYGQRAAESEIASAARLSEVYNVPHRVMSIPWLGELSGSSLQKNSSELPPELRLEQLDDATVTTESAASVWVPNRNGVFIAIASALAESMGLAYVAIGFNKEEAQTFPDNSKDFLDISNHALGYSTNEKVHLVSYTVSMNKSEIVHAVHRHQFPFHYVWSCYLGGHEPCGKCESCQRFKRAMDSLGEVIRYEPFLRKSPTYVPAQHTLH